VDLRGAELRVLIRSTGGMGGFHVLPHGFRIRLIGFEDFIEHPAPVVWLVTLLDL
jgi:hypothetical protein